MSAHAGRLRVGIELIDEPGWMGGTLYLRNLAVCLSRLPEGERPIIRLLGAPGAVGRFVEECGPVSGVDPASPRGLFERVLSRLLRNRRRAPIDVVYPGFGAPISGAVTMRWIPDFQHRYLPELFSSAEIAARDRAVGDIAARPGVVVLSSNTAAADFGRFFPDRRATERVWHFHSLIDMSAPAQPDPRIRHGLPEKYLYLPNQFWVHKNHITVFRALARLRRDGGLQIPLVCTGAQTDRRNTDHFASLQAFLKEQDLDRQVRLLGLLERREQVEVLRHAAALVQPSRFEGWSTVVEDARATGRPIYLSDLPVHREQMPQPLGFFRPESDQELAELLQRTWSDLEPGPDQRAERTARDQLTQGIIDSARNFCDIARAAVQAARNP